MARFVFEARDRQGRVVRGTREASSAGDLASVLQGRELSVTGIRPAPSQPAKPAAATAAPVAQAPVAASTSVGAAASPGFPGAGSSGGGVGVAAGPHAVAPLLPGAAGSAVAARDWTSRASAQSMSLYFRQMHALLHAGSSLGHALAVAARHDASPVLRRISERASRETSAGTPWSETMRTHPGVFSELMIGMVAAGEASGRVEEACRRLSEYCERDYHIQQTIKRETWYPKLLLAASIFIPSVVPLALKGTAAWWLSIQVPMALVVGAWLGWKGLSWVAPVLGQSKQLALVVDTIKLSVPVAKKVALSFSTAKLCRALGAGIGAGVPVNRAMTLAAGACDNEVLAQAVEKARLQVLAGDTLTGALSATRRFPPVAMQMLAVGEASGQTEEQLEKVADFLEGNAETAVKQAVKVVAVLALLLVAWKIGTQVMEMYVGTYTGIMDEAEKL